MTITSPFRGFILHTDAKGRPHSTAGPAVIDERTGFVAWCRHGVYHRPVADGPAVIYADGTGEFWVDGQFDGYKAA